MTLEEAEEIVQDVLIRSHKGFQINTKKYYKACEVIDLHRSMNANKDDSVDDIPEVESSLLNPVGEPTSSANT
jgi:hypothetical protein